MQVVDNFDKSLDEVIRKISRIEVAEKKKEIKHQYETIGRNLNYAGLRNGRRLRKMDCTKASES